MSQDGYGDRQAAERWWCVSVCVHVCMCVQCSVCVVYLFVYICVCMCVFVCVHLCVCVCPQDTKKIWVSLLKGFRSSVKAKQFVLTY